ncbi:pyruvate kinase [Thioclava sp. GXIMD4216]|uniref:pyruvate kinase n=1 Tax=Thioclava sp. GXIMD4216 TaxID=3131929 RepID=UPI0030CA9CEF
MTLHERETRERHAQAAGLRASLADLRAMMDRRAQAQMDLWESWITRPEFYPSARNLADYLSLGPGELAPFEAPFASFGISSLNRAEPHLRASIDAVLASLSLIAGQGPAEYPPTEIFAAGPARLAARRAMLFGARRSGTHARIMGSIGISCLAVRDADAPPRSAESHLRAMIGAGADAIRIDTGEGLAEDWVGLSQVVRNLAQDMGLRIPVQIDLPGPQCTVARVIGAHGRLRVGDRFEIVSKLVKGDFPRMTLSQPAQWAALTEGAALSINGGKLQGQVIRLSKGVARVEVTSTPARGARLKPGMVLAVPGVELDLPPLGEADLAVLDLALTYADNISVALQSVSDLETVFGAIDRLRGGAAALPALILRIETAKALHNLPDLIVAAGGRTTVGVMISRPELAQELGYARLTELQDMIFWLCRAAEVPVLWAPNLMERLVQEGRQSRAELNEAALSHPADCVLIGHGPQTIEALEVLSDTVLRAERYMSRSSARLGGFGDWLMAEG